YLCLGTMIIANPWERRWVPVGLAGLVLTLSTALIITENVESYRSQVRVLVLSPFRGAREAARVLRATADPSYRFRKLGEARQSFNASHGTVSDVVAGLRHANLHSDPWAIAAVWANDFTWRPVPVFQTYSAYTSLLDQLNGDSLQSNDGPSAVMRQQNPYVS